MEYAGSNPVWGTPNKEDKMAKAKFRIGDNVQTVTGMEGKVIAVDSGRGKVAVKATNDGVGHAQGTERSFFEGEVRKA